MTIRNKNNASVPPACTLGRNCCFPNCTCDLEYLKARKEEIMCEVSEIFPALRGDALDDVATVQLRKEQMADCEFELDEMTDKDLTAYLDEAADEREEADEYLDFNGPALSAPGIDKPPPLPHADEVTKDVNGEASLPSVIIVPPYKPGTVIAVDVPAIAGNSTCSVPMELRGNREEREGLAAAIWDKLSPYERNQATKHLEKTKGDKVDFLISYFYKWRASFNNSIQVPWEKHLPAPSVTVSAAKPSLADEAKRIIREEQEKEFADEVWSHLYPKEKEALEAKAKDEDKSLTDLIIAFYVEHKASFSDVLPDGLPWDSQKGKSSNVTAYKQCHGGSPLVYVHNKCEVYASAGRDVYLAANPSWDLRIICDGPMPKPISEASATAKKMLGSAADCVPSCSTPWIWIDWPDYGVPYLTKAYWDDLAEALAGFEGKVVINCMGGHGRTGTALAILASLHDVVPEDQCAVAWVRSMYCSQVVESEAQLRYIERMTGRDVTSDTRDKYLGYSSYSYKYTDAPKKEKTKAPKEKDVTPHYLKPAPFEPAKPDAGIPMHAPSLAETVRVGANGQPVADWTPEEKEAIKEERKRRKEERKARRLAALAKKGKSRKPRKGLGSY